MARMPCRYERRGAKLRENKEIEMPKGQQRSNKETKKPKQPKKLSVPASGGTVPPARSIMPPGKQK